MVTVRDMTYVLDPNSPVNADYVFISHAHIDHVCNHISNNLISSKETVALARGRGFNLPDPIDVKGVKLFGSGHVVGSRSILIDDEILYTGDIALRARAFMNAPRLPKARTLIIEATYGKKGYVFPSPAEVVDNANKLISEMYSRGKPVILCGYALGKAQIISYLFSSWDPIFVHESVKKMNEICSNLGVPLNSFKSYSQAKKEGLLDKKPWIIISPSSYSKNLMISSLRKKYGAVVFSFSGWAIDERHKYYSGADYPFPLSDHCDFNDLVKVVKHVDPEKVYTVHGYAKEFALALKSLGYSAQALPSHQSTITDFSPLGD